MFIRFLYFGYRIFTFLFRPVRMGVRVMMIRNGDVFLIRQTYRDGWFMPGGGVKRHETIEQAARREAREESGAELGEMKLIGIYTSFDEHKTDHSVLFTCEDFEFIGKSDNEIAESGFFSAENLPGGLMPGHRRKIEAYLNHQELSNHGIW